MPRNPDMGRQAGEIAARPRAPEIPKTETEVARLKQIRKETTAPAPAPEKRSSLEDLIRTKFFLERKVAPSRQDKILLGLINDQLNERDEAIKNLPPAEAKEARVQKSAIETMIQNQLDMAAHAEEKKARGKKVSNIIDRGLQQLEEPEEPVFVTPGERPAEEPGKTPDEMLERIVRKSEEAEEAAKREEEKAKAGRKKKTPPLPAEAKLDVLDKRMLADEREAGAKAYEEQMVRDVDEVLNSEVLQMIDAGAKVENRLNDIRAELKTLGYDLDVHPAKPPFWGVLTKKGRLITEFLNLSADKNYQYLLEARESEALKKKSPAERERAEKRATKRAMEYRTGGLVRQAPEVEEEEEVGRQDREAEILDEASLEKRKAADKLTRSERIKEGEKAAKMMKQIEEELAGFSLQPADLLKPLDRQTAKMLKNAGLDVKKLKDEYLSLVEDPNYKFMLERQK